MASITIVSYTALGAVHWQAALLDGTDSRHEFTQVGSGLVRIAQPDLYDVSTWLLDLAEALSHRSDTIRDSPLGGRLP